MSRIKHFPIYNLFYYNSKDRKLIKSSILALQGGNRKPLFGQNKKKKTCREINFRFKNVIKQACEYFLRGHIVDVIKRGTLHSTILNSGSAVPCSADLIYPSKHFTKKRTTHRKSGSTSDVCHEAKKLGLFDPFPPTSRKDWTTFSLLADRRRT